MSVATASRHDEHKPAASPPPSPSAGIDIPLICDPIYYSVKQLDSYPQPLAMVKQTYPRTALIHTPMAL
jgi:hypothetical protein